MPMPDEAEREDEPDELSLAPFLAPIVQQARESIARNAPEWQEFCAECGIKPTAREAKQVRSMFTGWLYAKLNLP